VNPFTATRNACKLCAPLGACVALRGIEGCIPLIHGSQGCATYIRRYTISHFREPVDIASSNFVETTAIFGGRDNLFTALDNVARSYRAASIGVTSTCLSETIGEDVQMYLNQYETARNTAPGGPVVFYAATPSYRGTHMDGYHEAIRAAVTKLVTRGDAAGSDDNAGNAAAGNAAGGAPRLNLISGFVSTEDLRELRRVAALFTGALTLLPDYSDTLDGVSWETYQKLPEGGTPLAAIARMGAAAATIYLGSPPADNAGAWLSSAKGVPLVTTELPIGIEAADAFCAALSRVTGTPVPAALTRERGRLVDAYIDGHKYVSGKRAVIYGEEDFVVALASFLDEIGVVPVVAATGAAGGGDGGAVNAAFTARVHAALRNSGGANTVITASDTDFATLLEIARDLKPDFIMGNSKGIYLARALGVPLVRCGFPIHDRIGGQRVLHLGYRGAIRLFDAICNTLLDAVQARHETGYTYL